jgi:hypothetical protein
MGCLRPGWSGTWQWPDGNEVASIGLRAEAEALHLSYRVRIGNEEWEDVAQVIPIARVPCRFGGCALQRQLHEPRPPAALRPEVADGQMNLPRSSRLA